MTCSPSSTPSTRATTSAHSCATCASASSSWCRANPNPNPNPNPALTLTRPRAPAPPQKDRQAGRQIKADPHVWTAHNGPPNETPQTPPLHPTPSLHAVVPARSVGRASPHPGTLACAGLSYCAPACLERGAGPHASRPTVHPRWSQAAAEAGVACGAGRGVSGARPLPDLRVLMISVYSIK